MPTLKTDDGWFSVRVGGIAVRDGRVLLHRAAADDFWTPPGGRLELNETLAEGLVREMLEETGLAVTPGRVLWTVENFFTWRGNPVHEIAFYLAMTVEADTPPTFPGREGNELLEFAWQDPVDPDLTLLPAFLKEGLQDIPDQPRHMVVRG